MAEKRCIRCGKTKPLDEYYRHSQMGDGHLNVCKVCKRIDSRLYSRTDAGREVEKRRNSTEPRRIYLRQNSDRWAGANPNKRKAHHLLWNALKRGDIVRPHTCQGCGRARKVQAHHADYDKPLDVEWLCSICHGKRLPHYIGEPEHEIM